MAEAIVLPKLGNTVESAIILAWHVAVGDRVELGDLLCEIETDKATLEIESSAAGVLLAQLRQPGDEVPVMSNIAVVGEAGESIAEFMPVTEARAPNVDIASSGGSVKTDSQTVSRPSDERLAISPRALHLARRQGVDYGNLSGSGPDGRIIERDIEAALGGRIKVTPVAQAMLDSGEFKLAEERQGSLRVRKTDLVPADEAPAVKAIPLKGIRKTIAKRMLESLRTTAQLTLNASADARALNALRKRLKESDESLGLREVTINDLLLFASARTLPAFPELNALFEDDIITQHESVHLAMAVDTDRGLLVPVIRNAEALTLRQLSAEAKRLAEACRAGRAKPDELSRGSFTVSNLGALGIESFTPVLNPPQVAHPRHRQHHPEAGASWGKRGVCSAYRVLADYQPSGCGWRAGCPLLAAACAESGADRFANGDIIWSR